jgi:hypothetical protein
MSDAGERAVVYDDGQQIKLVMYAMHAAKPLAEVEMSPIIALRLASELLRSASHHLWLREGQ